MSEINKVNNLAKKIKILVVGDSPACATGFGNVIHGIFKPLVETGRYEVDIFGINDRGGWKDSKEYPYRIWPAMLPGIQDDVYGRARFINILRGGNREVRPSWDIVFTLNDPFIFEAPMMVFNKGLMEMIRHIYDLYREKAKPDMWFKTVSYWPVDSSIKENWVEKAIGLSDYSVAYTKYGKREIEKSNNKCNKPSDKLIDVIYHGSDVKSYFPAPKEEVENFKKQFFKDAIQPSTFIVGCVARNQMRKDLPRVMKIFREFQKRRPDSFLYIHAQETDVWGSLIEYARNFNLEHGKDWTFPGGFDPNIGYPRKTLNLIYNMMDVQLYTSLGEGWCLPLVEAMSAKTLNLAPNITSIPEIFDTEGDDMEDLTKIGISQNIRGIPLKSGFTSSEWATYGPDDYERLRPLTNVDDAVKKLVWIYDNQDKVQGIVDRAYNWVQQFSWDKIAHEWDNYFQKVYNGLLVERKQGEELILKRLQEQVKEKLGEKSKEKNGSSQESNPAEAKPGEVKK